MLPSIVRLRFILDHPTTKRWITVLAYGVTGAAMIAYLGGRAAATAQQVLTFLCGEVGNGPTMALCLVGLVGLLGTHSITQPKFGHLRTFFRYPPLPVAVLVACVLTPVMPVIEDGWLSIPRPPLDACLAIAAFYAAIWMAPPIFHSLIGWAERHPKSLPTPKEDQSAPLSDAGLKDWLKREEPEGSNGMDLFGHTAIAERMLRRLGSLDTTIALHGEFGSGKSTVCNLMEALSKQRKEPLIFVRTSPWGFDDASRAQKDLLESILQELHKYVDVLGIRNLPTKYVEALAGASDQLSFVQSLHRLQRAPIDQLRRVTPLASAIGKQIVVIIEDLDRVGAKFDLGQISAMLMQLREVKGMSFILAISADQRIDFAKLCDHYESVPSLPATKVRNLVHQCREMLLREHPPTVPLSEGEALGLPEIDDGSSYRERQPFFVSTWQAALPDLLSRPRILKHVLRRVVDVWPRLTGEVNLDELITVSTLRVAAPEAFQLLATRQDRLHFVAQSKGGSHKDGTALIKADLTQLWQRVEELYPMQAHSIAVLLNRVSQEIHIVTGVQHYSQRGNQSMANPERGPIYAHRLFTESLERPEASDQHMANLILGSQDDPSKLKEIAALIIQSRAADDTFDWLRDEFRFTAKLELFSYIFELLRNQWQSGSHSDLRLGEHLLFDLEDMQRIPRYVAWLEHEVVKCIPGSLRLLTDVLHYGTRRLSREDGECVRKAVLARLKQSWSSASPDLIASGFDPRAPFTLWQLVFLPKDEEVEPVDRTHDWTWSAQPLFEAAKSQPGRALSQILFALRSEAESPIYEMDLENLRSWFGELARPLLLLIEEGFDPPTGLEERYRALLSTVPSAVKLVLQRFDQVVETPSMVDEVSPTGGMSERINLINE